MKTINRNELTKEMIEKAMHCETADELLKLAEAEGYEMTKDEADAYMAEMDDLELEDAELAKVAGGWGLCMRKCLSYYPD